MPWYHDIENDVKHNKKQVIIVIGTIVLGVFAFLAYRRSKANSSSSTPANATTGTTDAVGNPFDQTGQAFANAIASQSGIQEQISNRLKSLNNRVRNLNRKEAKQVRQNRHMEMQLRKLIHAEAPRKARHPSTKTGHKATHKHHASTPIRSK